MQCSLRHAASLLLVFLLAGTAVHAQPSAEEVLSDFESTLSSRMEGIDNFAVEAEVKGLPTRVSTTTYYQRTSGSMPAYESHTEINDGPDDASQAMSQTDMLTMSRKLHDYFSDTAEYEGTATVDGETTHVLHVSDITPLYQDLRGDAPQASQAEAHNARFYIDADEPLLRKMTADVLVTQQNGQPRTLKMTTLMQDYRTVASMPYPYRTVIQMDYQFTQQEKAQFEQQIQRAEAMLDKLPENRRAQMKKQIAAMRIMADGMTEITTNAQNVQVNTEIPQQHFDSTG